MLVRAGGAGGRDDMFQRRARIGAQILVADHSQVIAHHRHGPRPSVETVDDARDAAIGIAHEIEDIDLGPVRRIGVQRLLAGPHPVAPLEILRHRHIARIARQKYHTLAAEMLEALGTSQMITDIIVMREEHLRRARIAAVVIVEFQHVLGLEAEMQLVESRQHHPEPRAPALAP